MATEWSQNSSDRVTETWKTLADTYGPRFLRDYGEKVPSVWDSAVRSLTTAQIQRGIRRLCAAGSAHPPTLPQFVKACKATGDDEGVIRPGSTYLPQPQLSWQMRTGNRTLLSFLLANGPVPEASIPKLVETKNRIVSTAADSDDATDLRDVLMAAFRTVAA